MKNKPSIQQLFSFGLASAPLLLFFFPLYQVDFIWGPQWSFLYFLPYALFASAGLLALSLNQSRIVFISVLCMFLFALGTNPAIWPMIGIGSNDLYNVIYASTFISAALVFLSGESRYWSPKGVLRLVAVILPLCVLWDLSLSDSSILLLVKESFLVSIHGRTGISALMLIPPTIFVLVSFLRGDRNTKAFLHNFSLSTIPFLVLLSHAHSIPIVVLSFLVVSSLMLHGVVQMYWQRVYVDELTGIPNRRALEDKMMSIDPSYIIAMLDIDHFKKFNDTYGHHEGDNVLRFVAEHIYKQTEGRAYRYGGEEFTVVFERIGLEEVVEVLDHAREDLANRSFYIRKPDGGPKEAVQITISIGIAEPADLNNTPKKVMEEADQALYSAKENGRDCVAVA